MTDIDDIQKNIFAAKKKLYNALKNEYRIYKTQFSEDPYNYNKIVNYKNKKKYIMDLLRIDNINQNYFFKIKTLIPSEEELGNLNIILNKLWELDYNKLLFNRDLRINLQNNVSLYSLKDEAPYPFFDYVNLKKIQLPTFRYFIKISKFFSKQLGISEADTVYKINKIKKFIDSLCDTKIFIYLYNFLNKKGIVKHFLDFPSYIYNLWFGSIYKKSINDSSLFEHIFMGEIVNDKIIGFHNWIQLFQEERIGRANYFGYIKVINKNFPYVADIKFSWENNIKKAGTLFIGTSPEFEFVLYTICYHYTSNNDNNVVSFNIFGNDVKIKIIRKNNIFISAYPFF